MLDALVAYDPSDRLIPEVIAFFVATKQDNRWNSTKATAMVLYAMTDVLGKQGAKPGAIGGVDYTLDGGAPVHVAFTDGLARKITVDGARLKSRTTIAFAAATPGMMARAVLRYHATGRDLKPATHGLEVERTLYLLGSTGARVRALKQGEHVPRGAYIESVVAVHRASDETMPYLLVEDPKPTGAEALPLDDPRFGKTPVTWSLREDRERHVAFHHEQAPATTTVRTVLHLEMAGQLAIPPAQAELMYQTETRGHSGTFALVVD
ncbi:MAG TPA: hypothetical protein VFQ53_22235 [Kofleriaceae bacterium]|nr:hypothetical protein [Kofleriaceae bacterium]